MVGVCCSRLVLLTADQEFIQPTRRGAGYYYLKSNHCFCRDIWFGLYCRTAIHRIVDGLLLSGDPDAFIGQGTLSTSPRSASARSVVRFLLKEDLVARMSTRRCFNDLAYLHFYETFFFADIDVGQARARSRIICVALAPLERRP